MHPEDMIHEAKTFINELARVQEQYFVNLVNKLKITKTGEEFLFDYIYNSVDDKLDDFGHFLEQYNKTFNDMLDTNATHCNTLQSSLLFSDHMSSMEPELETTFCSYFS